MLPFLFCEYFDLSETVQFITLNIEDMSVYVFWLLSCWIAVRVGAKTTQSGRIHNVTEDGWEGARDIIEHAARLGLHASEHAVRTEDGYVLRLFRVRGTGEEAYRGPPVLVMHGLLQSAGGWLDADGASLGAQLAASGRDLWLGNARGCQHSRRHAWLRPDTDSLFWRFSGDEIGRYDLPALIDYILDSTGASKLNYIGFSQGGGTFFIMCSERPEYCDKVNLMIALGPATRMLHTKSIPFRFANEYYEYNEEELHKNGIWEALPAGGLVQSFVKNFCGLFDSETNICEAFVDVLDGSNPKSKSRSALRALTTNFPAGTSVHNMAWFGQHVKSGHYHKFDYGPDQNLVYYGSKTAPAHNLSAVTVPTVVIYGRNDGVVDVRDVKWAIRKLPNVRKVFEMEDPRWTHLDFLISKNIPTLLYPKIEEMLG